MKKPDDMIQSYWAFFSTLPSIHASILRQWQRYLKPDTERIFIDHIHMIEAVAALEVHTIEGAEIIRYILCDAQMWIECLDDFRQTAAAVGGTGRGGIDRCSMIVAAAQHRQQKGKMGALSKTYVKSVRRRMLKIWTYKHKIVIKYQTTGFLRGVGCWYP